MSSILRSFLVTFSVITCCRGLLNARIEDHALDILSRGDQGSAKTHIYKEGMPLLASRSDLVKRADIHHDYPHELVFAVKQNNIDELERALHDVSDPTSPNYGQHWSGEQVGAMTSNIQARDATVSYLQANGATIKSESRYGEYITAVAPISMWDKALNTQFFKFHQRQLNGDVKETIRAEAYSIPIELDEHVTYVLNAIEMPVRVTMKGETYEVPPEYTTSKKSSKSHMDTSRYSYGYVLPHDLRRYYNFSTSHGSALSTQEAYAGGDDWLNPEDLALFQSLDHIKLNQPAIAGSFGHVSGDPTVMGPNGYHGGGNLDIQYLIAMSPESPTIYGWHPSSISCWMLTMTDMLIPPRVLSISYGLEEVYNSYAEYAQFNTEVIKLSLRGTTLVAASGDDGAVSGAARGGALHNCGYYPLFPASHPYVVAVGATSGAENNEREVVCSAGTTGRITSGGGFSQVYSQPNYQAKAVSDYFVTAAATGKKPFPGFNAGGRAYPDISMQGLNYLVIMYGQYGGKAGTSASTPVAAAAISNINAARMAVGKGTLGWMNPALYTHAASFVNDIVTGNNTCSATTPCCPHGFHATKGWDPATGLGSINYGKMEATFLALGAVTNGYSRSPTPSPSTSKPSVVPTQSPTRATSSPTTSKPSAEPTLKTKRPTPVPTVRPNKRRPTFRPSAFKAGGDSSSNSPATVVSVTQTLIDALICQTDNTDFADAVANTVISVLGVPEALVTDITTTASGRRLLSGVTLSYTVSVDGMTPELVIASLQTSVSTGDFLTMLSDISGAYISEVTNLQTADLSSTKAPAMTPDADDSSSTTTAAVASGCVGGLLFGVLASFLYFNRSKGEKKKLPPIHTHVAAEDFDDSIIITNSNCDRDMIPKTSLPTSPHSPMAPSTSSPPPGYKPIKSLKPLKLQIDEVYPASQSSV